MVHVKLVEPCRYDKANAVNKLFNWWITEFFNKHRSKPFGVSELYKCSKDDLSEKLGDRLNRQWEIELERAKVPSLTKAIIKVFGPWYLFISCLVSFVICVIRPAQTVSLGLMVQYLSQYQEEKARGDQIDESWTSNEYCVYYCAVILIFITFMNVVFSHPYFMETFRLGMQIRIACCQMIYRKALKLSSASLRTTTVGQIVNLLSNDVIRFDWCLVYTAFLFAGPLHVAIATIIIWVYLDIGVPCMAGVAVLFLYVPFQGLMGNWFSRLRIRTALLTDERVRLMNEIVPAMRVIKMYTWEKPFAKLVELARKLEVAKIKNTAFLRGVNLSMFFVSSKIITFLILILYLLQSESNQLTAVRVFVALSLIDGMRSNMTLYFPYGVSTGAEALISIGRIQEFLQLEEKQESENLDTVNLKKGGNLENLEETESIDSILEEDEGVEDVDEATSLGKVKSRENKATIFINNATASLRIGDEKKNIIKDMSFRVVPGELTVIIGPCGSGKSSVLLSILGELPVTSGNIRVRGKIAYAAQEPWIFAATVRENILFGNKFDERKYKNVIHAAALERDMEIFAHGDKTMVGERGVSLSGGQRARINLARALYNDADIYLLDDPLSAVDANVATHIFQKCVRGYLKDKTVILVTHQLQFIKAAPQIVVLKEGNLVKAGSHLDLLREGIDFIRMAGDTDIQKAEEQPHRPLLRRQSSTGSSAMFGSRVSISSQASVVDYVPEQELGMEEIIDDPSNEDDEMGTEQQNSNRLYWIYVKAGAGPLILPLLILANTVTQITFTGGDYWLSLWTNYNQQKGLWDKEHLNPNSSSYNQSAPSPPFVVSSQQNDNIYIYSGIVVTLFSFALVRTTSFFTICMRASISLHNRLFNSVIRAPIAFFDNNPIGRLLNRCSRDLGLIDDLLPPTFFDTLEIMVNCTAICVLCIIIDYWNAIAVLFLVTALFFIRRYYIGTARRIKKVEGVARSPVFTHLSTSLYGLTTIRAFGCQSTFEVEFDKIQDVHTAAWFFHLASCRWFGIVLDLLSTFYITITTVLLVIDIDSKTPSAVALAISQAIMISGMFQWGVRQWAELESQMTSVDRVLEYSNLPQEMPLEDNRKPPESWPSRGQITYEDVYLQYSSNDPPVLRGLSFRIDAGEKIGIVGRTGAGKSSIIATLFRMTEPTGLIAIDGVDTGTISLHDLRKNISIIPQEPILFTGPVRRNIDPFNEDDRSVDNDGKFWGVLDKVQLKNDVISLPGKLDEVISEGGGNFSVGQRQLICLARAILRENRILVLDEATANVDPKTDSLIQQTIRDQFDHCTVLTIAHRLHTIMDSDRILVMDAGQVAEFDSAYNLLKNPNGIFAQMVETTGRGMKEMLKEMAKLKHESAKTQLKGTRDRLDTLRQSISMSGNIPIIEEERPELERRSRTASVFSKASLKYYHR